MENFVISLLNLFKIHGLWTVLFVIAVYLIFKKKPFKIYEHVVQRRDKSHELALELLQSEKLEELDKSLLREHLATTAFRKYRGIEADAKMRAALAKFVERHRETVTWTDIRRAYPNIRRGGSLGFQARLSREDHVLRWLVNGLVILGFCYSFLLVLAAFLGSYGPGSRQFFGLLGSSLVVLVGSVVISSANRAYYSTQRVIRAAKQVKINSK